jgi:hypothetical protein
MTPRFNPLRRLSHHLPAQHPESLTDRLDGNAPGWKAAGLLSGTPMHGHDSRATVRPDTGKAKAEDFCPSVPGSDDREVYG